MMFTTQKENKEEVQKIKNDVQSIRDNVTIELLKRWVAAEATFTVGSEPIYVHQNMSSFDVSYPSMQTISPDTAIEVVEMAIIEGYKGGLL
ncbi:hypothetical protein [Salinicoccus albus]|uniref:hypothetical protein n=1 Tax=Salinicoccus albus TaxID=418756 RepID=UPI000377DE70|nr:hypothetical protein [Salinicoccus albus]